MLNTENKVNNEIPINEEINQNSLSSVEDERTEKEQLAESEDNQTVNESQGIISRTACALNTGALTIVGFSRDN